MRRAFLVLTVLCGLTMSAAAFADEGAAARVPGQSRIIVEPAPGPVDSVKAETLPLNRKPRQAFRIRRVPATDTAVIIETLPMPDVRLVK